METPSNQDQQELERTFAELAQDFAAADNQVRLYETKLQEWVAAFYQTVTSPFPVELSKENAVYRLFSGLSETCADICREWLQMIEQTGKNLSFREKLNDSMLVYVYGRVKSGKSSLGNFIAYGKMSPSQEHIAVCPPVDFDVEVVRKDMGTDDLKRLDIQQKSTREERRFLVDFLEATACIQYFRKPGFTWIDSPGIHSTTPANGELAQKYLGSADLVIYTSTARSAMQEQDRKELLEILKSGKPFLLVITRCDDRDYDVDDAGNIFDTYLMKPEEEQAEIRKWVKNSLCEEAGDSLSPEARNRLDDDIILLSCKYAEEHLHDEEWEKSGLPLLFRRMGEIARADGVRIKRNIPLYAVQEHISTIRSGMDSLDERMGKALQQLQIFREQFHQQCENEKYQCKIAIKKMAGDLADRYYGNDALFRKEFAKGANTAVNDAYQKLAQALVQDTGEILSQLSPKGDIPGFPEFKTYFQTTHYRESGKRCAGTIVGTLIGGIAGAFLGGVPGAGVGISLGSTIGSSIGNQFDEEKTCTTAVGDNRVLVMNEATAGMCAKIDGDLSYLEESIQDKYMTPLERWLNDILDQKKAFSTFLDTMSEQITQEIH